MNILFLSHKFYPDIGGIEANSEILATAFANAGHEVHLLTWSSGKGNRSFPFTIIRKPSVAKICKEHKWADIVFENNPCMRMAWPGIFFRKPSVIALNTWVNPAKNNMQDRIKYWWLRRAKKIIAVSSAVRNRCWPEAIVISNPYNTSDFKIVKEVSKTSAFAFLGRLVSDKGADQAVKAIDLLISKKKMTTSNDDNDYLLTIIGDGPERIRLETMVEDLQLEKFVHFTGALSGKDLAMRLNRYRFLLVPSVWEEPFGNVVLEGMACGCLPIASNGGGLPDAVGNAGLLFERGNVNELAACMELVLDDSFAEEKYHQVAAHHLAAHDPAIVSRKYLDVIENVVACLN